MLRWPSNPRIYEIDTIAWIVGLSRKHGRRITLADVPREEWNAVAELGIDGVWLMGVWSRSEKGRAKALENPVVLDEIKRVSPGFGPEDVVCSPFCVKEYVVDERLGGTRALAEARKELAKRGLLLVLDFVPNHTAMDHPWVSSRPDFYIQGSLQDLHENPGLFTELPGGIFALGKDPYFPAWNDVVQLNAFNRAQRKAAAGILTEISGMCDGVRCDMAMLLMNDVFERTWGEYAGPMPDEDYWEEVIAEVRRHVPDVVLIAEAYWDLEWSLMQQGFDYCYDKRLYDRLVRGNASSVRIHLRADEGFQRRLVRFLENHDEPRAVGVMGEARLRAASVVMATVPGMKLFYEGQFDGKRVHAPVQLAARPEEEVNRGIREFSERLLKVTKDGVFAEGRWALGAVSGWVDNASFTNLLAWTWRLDNSRRLVVVNFSERSAQGMVDVRELGLAGARWSVSDLMTGDVYHTSRDGDELEREGLYVDLAPWGYHILMFEAAR